MYLLYKGQKLSMQGHMYQDDLNISAWLFFLLLLGMGGKA